MKKAILLMLLVLAFCISLTACGGETPAQPAAAGQPAAEPAPTPEPTPTPAITLTVPADTLPVGGELQLEAALTNSNGSIVWSSSDAAVVSVDANGTVKGLKAGKVTISAALSDVPEVKDQVELTVLPAVSGLELAETELTLLTGSPKADAKLDVKIIPGDAYYQGLQIESSDTEIVEIDAEGMLHAVAPGSATITIGSEDPDYGEVVRCEVTVLRGVESITLSQTEATLYKNESLRLKAEVLPKDAVNRAVVWASSDEAVITVDQNGSAKAVGIGSATISCTAQDGSGLSAACSVNVVIGVKQVTLSEKKAFALLNGPEELSVHQLTYTITPEDASFQDVTWVSSDEAIATVDEKGLVKALAPGRVTITAFTTDPKVADRVKASCSFEVGSAVQGLEISADSDRVVKGRNLRLKAVITPTDAYSKDVLWTSSNESVLTVDAHGQLKAIGVGTAKVTCTAADGSGVAAEKTFTVYQPVSSVSSSRRDFTLFAGQSGKLFVTVAPSDATDKSVSWTSSNSGVASVDGNGNVSAWYRGRTRIEAKANDGSGKSCSFNITVEPRVPISLDSLGFGIYNPNLLGITVSNLCISKAIVNFDFTIQLYDYAGNLLVTSGEYNLGNDETVGAGRSATIRRTHSGVSQAQKVIMTITGVYFSDGSYYYIPSAAQETWIFTR